MTAQTHELYYNENPAAQTVKERKGIDIKVIDFSKRNITIANGDTLTIKANRIAANTVVTNVDTIVETVDDTVNASVGDSASASTWTATVPLQTLGLTVSTGARKLYGSETYISLVIANSSGSAYTLTDGKVKIIVEYIAK